ncbi:MAG: hypothetical protein AAGE80_09555 [Pseudomonadota bacterium]
MKYGSLVVFVFIGATLTVGYLGFAFYVLDISNQSFWELKLNEKGDFLAGVCGPVALIWLILGILMQGFELRNSITEIEKTSKANMLIAEVAQKEFDQLMKDRANEETKRKTQLQPRFILASEGGSGGTPIRSKFGLTNTGEVATNIKFQIVSEDKVDIALNIKERDSLLKNEKIQFALIETRPADSKSIILLEISYDDLEGDRGSFMFELHRKVAKPSVRGARPFKG